MTVSPMAAGAVEVAQVLLNLRPAAVPSTACRHCGFADAFSPFSLFPSISLHL